jgi:hypothetical protein
MTTKHKKSFTDATKSMDLRTLTDSLYLFCCDVEQTLREMGAEPGNDYTQLDLLDRALKIWEHTEHGSLKIAEALHTLGLRDASTPFGALELLSKELRDGLDGLSGAVASLQQED